MSFKKRPEKKTFPKQRPYRQSLFSLLFLLSGIYGICLLLLSVPGLRWNRGEVFLLAGLPGILLWYLDGRKRRLFLCLVLLSAVAAVPARCFCSVLEGIGIFAVLPKNILPLICASALFGAIFMVLAFLLRIREARLVTEKLLRRFSKP